MHASPNLSGERDRRIAVLRSETSNGLAGILLDSFIAHARSSGRHGLHFDIGYTRHAAHRLCLIVGLQLSCHHLTLELT